MSAPRAVRTLLFSSLYPSSQRPGHGIFVENRLRELASSGRVHTRVIAPVPWFFSTDPRYGDYAKFAKTPLREMRHGFDVQHPRYLLAPKVGMNLAPFAMALGAAPAVRRLIREGFDFDVIDAHYFYPDGVAAALLARRFNKPFTITARGTDINLIPDHAVPRQLMRWAARHAHACIGVSQALAAKMAQIGMPPTKILVMPNGVDLNLFNVQPQSEARAALGWPAGPTLLSVGNLVENKGHHIAIQALNGLPQFRLVIAGEGPQRQALEGLAAELGLAERVSFAGRVDQRQLATYYSAADLLVLMSSREGWPNVLLESMACGTPVVATNVGGIPEIITSPSAGSMLQGRTPEELATAVASLWKNLPGRTLVREIAEQRSWRNTTLSQIDLFNRIAGTAQEAAHA